MPESAPDHHADSADPRDPPAARQEAQRDSNGPRQRPPAICILSSDVRRLFGLTPAERLRRQVSRLGAHIFIESGQLGRHDGPVLIIRGDAVIDAPLLPVLLERRNLLLLASDGSTPIAAHVPPALFDTAVSILEGRSPVPAGGPFLVKSPASLEADFWKSLRKRETPYALLLDESGMDDIEWRMFMGTYKGATDLVTKHLWPRPAFLATRYLAPRGVTPNMVTLVGIALVFLAFYLFLNGQFMAGLAAAWIMTFLDTVDGKLARTTLSSSKWGDILDHGVDLVHPPFWYIAWASGLSFAGYMWSAGLYWSVVVAILAGYVLQRVMEGVAIKWLGLEIHIWRPIDTLFRQVTARRNPNLIILTAATLLGRPDWGLIAVAAWTVICLLLHGLQLAQALAARRHGPLASWMSKPQ